MMRDILASFAHVQKAGHGWTARCPAHDDQRNSLSIGRGENGRWLLKCHAGCSVDAILVAARLETADLFPPSTEKSRIVAIYDYREHELLYQVVRSDPKTFRQRRPDGQGGWIWNLNGTKRVVYRLPDLQGRKTVFVCEGERDADRLWSLELPATSNAGGAGRWRAEYAAQLKAAGCQHVIVLPDNDPPGETHGRDVARSCADVGLSVKLIPLPELPPKGDVSDYLTQHSKDELLAIVRDAPLFDPVRRVAESTPIALTSLADLLSEPDDQVDYIVADRIPAGAVVLLVAPPKAGKSTMARELAFAVSRGEPWLGWRTAFGPVWLLVFEDKRSAVRTHFRQMGATGTEPIRLFVDQAPADLLPRLQVLGEQERPSLIIVDTVGRLIKAKDFNDYAEITQRFEPLLKLSRTTGATLLLLHHASAHAQREGLDAVLGSTAVSGSVDNILILRRIDQQRVFSSVQRIGPDLEATVIMLNADTGRLERVGTKRQHDDRELIARMLAALRTEPEPVSESWLQDHVEGRNQDKVRVLRQLFGMGQVERCGAGGRKDPYRYRLADSCSRGSESSCSGDSERDENSPHAGTSNEAEIPALFPCFDVRVPEVPSYISREQGNKNLLRTTVRPSFSHDPRVLVPVVPGTSEKHEIEAVKRQETPDKTGLSSCSRDAEYERF